MRANFIFSWWCECAWKSKLYGGRPCLEVTHIVQVQVRSIVPWHSWSGSELCAGNIGENQLMLLTVPAQNSSPGHDIKWSILLRLWSWMWSWKPVAAKAAHIFLSGLHDINPKFGCEVQWRSRSPVNVGKATKCREGHFYRTGPSKFLGFWTPSLPLVSTKSTQPPFLSSEIGQPYGCKWRELILLSVYCSNLQ